jgi:hypothetical protein
MGLLKTAGRAAVASSVHGRVQRRQQSRWAEQERRAEAAQRQQFAAPPPAPTPSAPASAGSKDTREQLELLAQLGELKNAGVLTEEEFANKKAEILKG